MRKRERNEAISNMLREVGGEMKGRGLPPWQRSPTPLGDWWELLSGGGGGRNQRGGCDVVEEGLGGGGVEAGHGIADVDEEVVAGGRIGEEGQGDGLADAAVVDGAAAVEAFAGGDGEEAAGDGKTHGLVSGWRREGVVGLEEG